MPVGSFLTDTPKHIAGKMPYNKGITLDVMGGAGSTKLQDEHDDDVSERRNSPGEARWTNRRQRRFRKARHRANLTSYCIRA